MLNLIALGIAPRTRRSWMLECAQRYEDTLGITPTEALACAGQCATAQDDFYGSVIRDWDAPNDVADQDIANWDRADADSEWGQLA